MFGYEKKIVDAASCFVLLRENKSYKDYLKELTYALKEEKYPRMVAAAQIRAEAKIDIRAVRFDRNLLAAVYTSLALA